MDTPNVSMSQKMDAIKKMTPLIELSASVALIYQEEPRLFSFMAEAISSGKALDNLIVWFERYLVQLESEVIAQHDARFPRWLGFFINEAYAAISADARNLFILQLRDLMKVMDDLGLDTTSNAGVELAAANFQESLEIFQKNANTITARLMDGPANDMLILKAFAVAQRVGGPNAVTSLSNLSGFNRLGFGVTNLTKDKFVEAISLMPLNRIKFSMTEAQHIALDKELAKLFKKMSSESFGVAKGANHQMLSVINRSLADDIDEVTVALEHKEIITFGGQQFGRVYDEVVEIGGNPRYIDGKAWTPTYLDRGLKNELSFKVSATDGNDQLGGLLKEIVIFEKNERRGFNARWDFSPEVGSKEEIANKLKHILDNDKAVKGNIQKVLGFETETQWTEFVTTFDSKVREGFFKIEDYANLKAKLNL